MDKTKLSSRDRFSLGCYVRAQNRPISFGEVFQFYSPNLLRNGSFLLIGCVIAFMNPPSATSIPVNYATGYCLLTALILYFLNAAWVSYRSTSHWELLKQVLNWDRVHQMLDEATD